MTTSFDRRRPFPISGYLVPNLYKFAHVFFFLGYYTLAYSFYKYIHQVNGVKLAEIMFSLLCVCVRLCAVSPISLNGWNDVLYSIRA